MYCLFHYGWRCPRREPVCQSLLPICGLFAAFLQEFSLAREQREEELEKERLQKEKEDARERERKARQDYLDRYTGLSKRSRPRGRCIRGHGSEKSRGAAGEARSSDTASGAGETRRSSRFRYAYNNSCFMTCRALYVANPNTFVFAVDELCFRRGVVFFIR